MNNQDKTKEKLIKELQELQKENNFLKTLYDKGITDSKQAKQELILANKALILSEENFRHSISEFPLGIRIISIDGKTIYANKAFLDIFEFNSLEKLRSIPAINRYTPESYAQHQERKEKRKNGHDIFDYELSIARENAEVRHVRVWRKEVLWNGVKHYQAFNLDTTKQKRAEEALKNSQQKLKLFAAHLQNIREEERKDLAREIHDDLGQILVAMKIDLGFMKQKVLKNIDLAFLEDITTKFDYLFNLLDNTIKTSRRIMTGLRPEALELLGFVEATRLYAIDFQERHRVTCQFESPISKLKINSQQSIAFFRILQEALTNIAKHAKATVVKIQLRNQNNKLIMEIIDNGIGFDENQKIKHDSYGLIGMRERIFLLKGELIISGKLGKGTSVRVDMPYISERLSVPKFNKLIY